jgi:hypothetical protein
MEWNTLFPAERQPSMEEIENYINGEAKELWHSLMEYMKDVYNTKPKLTYSVCSGKPGWNVKFQKSGQSFGTLYPEEDSFSVFIVISYKLDPHMEDIFPKLSSGMVELYKQAGDYMKLGKWMMFRIKDETGLNDYKQLVEFKLQLKNV